MYTREGNVPPGTEMPAGEKRPRIKIADRSAIFRRRRRRRLSLSLALNGRRGNARESMLRQSGIDGGITEMHIIMYFICNNMLEKAFGGRTGAGGGKGMIRVFGNKLGTFDKLYW